MNTTDTETTTDTLQDDAFGFAKRPSFTPILLRAPLAAQEAYYRSTTFVSELGINPLTAAASPLLVINARLKQTTQYEDIHLLYQQLVHEIKAFESRAQTDKYRAETILVARYVLCATIDETIMNTVWGKTIWQHQLLNTFQREDNVAERFFLILDRISEDANHHIDLLELIYLCLSAGYEGKFRILHHGKLKLDAIIDTLYRKICKQREELTTIFQTAIAPTIKTKIKSKTKKSTIITSAVISSLFCLVIFYAGLWHASQPLNLTTQQMSQALAKIHGTE